MKARIFFLGEPQNRLWNNFQLSVVPLLKLTKSLSQGGDGSLNLLS